MNQKYVFLQALIITFIIFNLGIFLGYQLETSRVNKIDKFYLESEMELLDQRIQKDALDIITFECDSIVQENIDFGNRIFEEALQIQKIEDANKINSDVIFQHKRFDLLRTLFWINSINIKKKCNSDYHNVVYFYKYNSPSLEQKAKQRFFSNLLVEIKQKQGDNIMLIPIAADNDLPSINLLLDNYDLEEFPVLLIDEKIKITEVNDISDVEKYLD